MEKILNLTLSYPDFQLNQIIDPDQVDLNNAQIVDKVNKMINSFNTFTGNTAGDSGAKHITVDDLPVIGRVSNIQEAFNALILLSNGINGAKFIGAKDTELVKGTNVQMFLDELSSVASELLGRMDNIESRASNHESIEAELQKKVTSIETLDVSQNSRLASLETRATSSESVNTTQDTRIAKNENDITFQKQQISDILSKNVQQDTRITNAESKNTSQDTTIKKLQDDIARINVTNTNQEVVDARGTKPNLKTRIDFNEINIGSNHSTLNKVNFLVTDSNATDFWEDKVKVGDLLEHESNPNAHGGTITSHEANTNCHADIRTAIANISTNWDGISGKPIQFPPTTHTHTKSQINDFTHTHSKSEISDFAHTHTKSQISDFAHSHTKTEVGLSNVDNVKQMPITGGTFTGDVNSTAKIIGHVVIPYGRPSNIVNGSIWIE